MPPQQRTTHPPVQANPQAELNQFGGLAKAIATAAMAAAGEITSDLSGD